MWGHFTVNPHERADVRAFVHSNGQAWVDRVNLSDVATRWLDDEMFSRCLALLASPACLVTSVVCLCSTPDRVEALLAALQGAPRLRYVWIAKVALTPRSCVDLGHLAVRVRSIALDQCVAQDEAALVGTLCASLAETSTLRCLCLRSCALQESSLEQLWRHILTDNASLVQDIDLSGNAWFGSFRACAPHSFSECISHYSPRSLSQVVGLNLKATLLCHRAVRSLLQPRNSAPRNALFPREVLRMIAEHLLRTCNQPCWKQNAHTIDDEELRDYLEGRVVGVTTPLGREREVRAQRLNARR